MQRLAILFVCLLLQACSATTRGLGTSLWHSVAGGGGVQLTDDEIAEMRYASQYMSINNGPQLFVVLAYNEDGQQKWVTQDRSVIVTQNGRIGENVRATRQPDGSHQPDQRPAGESETDQGWRELDPADGLD
ncbi:Group 4 capsule protein B homolog [Cedecea neteri]|uniref:Group 4 capsule protein B homolog n=1 Tax=Cedecea neteri TaxID=158822 RepID=A0A2X2T1N7_9ENTR|nr:Group 4 capsule protein B homolog [Cedecea neteri]